MKLFKLSYGLVAATLLLVSCDINKYPEFDDANAFVAIQKTSASIAENQGTLQIPVMLTSLSGIQGSVDFTLTPAATGGAVEGTHYKLLNSGKTLTFTKDEPVQYIQIEPIDNDTFGGDVRLTITLENAQGVQVGAVKECNVTIEDDEHPLSFILGTLTAKGPSYFNGDQEWSVTFEKDASDLSKVWIYNLVEGGSGSDPVYGVVNEEKTEIHIPVGQEIAKSSSYGLIALEGFYGEDGEEDIPLGGYITGIIDADGTITLQDWFGSHVYNDAAGTSSAGWYNIFQAGVVLKK